MNKDKDILPEIDVKRNLIVKSDLIEEEDHELEKSKSHIIIELIEYVPNSVSSKIIIEKTTGNITVSSFDKGQELAQEASHFDNNIQIIEGAADVVINDKTYKLKFGEEIIIPAHASHSFKANERFKMISTIIKNGYED